MPGTSTTKVFFDSDTIIAGSASRRGASFILLQLSELGLIQGFTSQKVVDECRKNLQMKLPDALSNFEQIISRALVIVKNPSPQQISKYNRMADIKDISILTAALMMKVRYLVTFNTRDYYPDPKLELSVVEPGELLQLIRRKLSEITGE